MENFHESSSDTSSISSNRKSNDIVRNEVEALLQLQRNLTARQNSLESSRETPPIAEVPFAENYLPVQDLVSVSSPPRSKEMKVSDISNTTSKGYFPSSESFGGTISPASKEIDDNSSPASKEIDDNGLRSRLTISEDTDNILLALHELASSEVTSQPIRKGKLNENQEIEKIEQIEIDIRNKYLLSQKSFNPASPENLRRIGKEIPSKVSKDIHRSIHNYHNYNNDNCSPKYSSYKKRSYKNIL